MPTARRRGRHREARTAAWAWSRAQMMRSYVERENRERKRVRKKGGARRLRGALVSLSLSSPSFLSLLSFLPLSHSHSPAHPPAGPAGWRTPRAPGTGRAWARRRARRAGRAGGRPRSAWRPRRARRCRGSRRRGGGRTARASPPRARPPPRRPLPPPPQPAGRRGRPGGPGRAALPRRRPSPHGGWAARGRWGRRGRRSRSRRRRRGRRAGAGRTAGRRRRPRRRARRRRPRLCRRWATPPAQPARWAAPGAGREAAWTARARAPGGGGGGGRGGGGGGTREAGRAGRPRPHRRPPRPARARCLAGGAPCGGGGGGGGGARPGRAGRCPRRSRPWRPGRRRRGRLGVVWEWTACERGARPDGRRARGCACVRAPALKKKRRRQLSLNYSPAGRLPSLSLSLSHTPYLAESSGARRRLGRPRAAGRPRRRHRARGRAGRRRHRRRPAPMPRPAGRRAPCVLRTTFARVYGECVYVCVCVCLSRSPWAGLGVARARGRACSRRSREALSRSTLGARAAHNTCARERLRGRREGPTLWRRALEVQDLHSKRPGWDDARVRAGVRGAQRGREKRKVSACAEKKSDQPRSDF